MRSAAVGKWLPLAALIGLVGCSTEPADQNPAGTKATPAVVATTLSTADCQSRMQKFMRWYLGFASRNDTSTMIFNWPVEDPNEPQLSSSITRGNVSKSRFIEFNAAKFENYMDSLQASGYFSTSYLQHLRSDMGSRGRELAAAHITEPVEMAEFGFSADPVFYVQELFTPEDVARLRYYHSVKAAPGTRVYGLPAPDGSTGIGFPLFVKTENGLCVIDSIKPGITTHN